MKSHLTKITNHLQGYGGNKLLNWAGSSRFNNTFTILNVKLGTLVMVLSIFILSATQIFAQISPLSAWTNVYHGTSTSTQNITYAVPTGSNTNRVLVVAIANTIDQAGARTVTLTYGGQTLTSVAGDMATTTVQQHTQLYYLNEAGLDAAINTTLSVRVTGGGGITTLITDVSATVFDGVDQTTPITDSKTYSSGTSTTTTPIFGTALTVNAGDQSVEILSCYRSGSSTTRSITYATNWTMVDEQTATAGGGGSYAIRNGVANRSVPGTNTTDLSSTTFSGSALGSMTGLSLKAAAPTATLVAGTLTAFGPQCINLGPYGPGSFTLTGTNLTSADVTVGALAGFTYSATSGGTYGTTLTITPSGGAISTTVYVRFSPTLVQSYSGDIAVSGGGASTINVAASGSGVNTLPTVTANAATGISPTTATIPGNITNTGCTTVTAYGIEWSTSTGFPNGTGTLVAGSNLVGTAFSVPLSGLTPTTNYYYHTWATNGGGTSYSTQLSFITSSQTITTGTITGSPFCAGASVLVPYTITGAFTAGNVFTAQLSGSTGSWTSPVPIGTLTQVTAGTISGVIPAGTTTGTGYRIRVVSSTPPVTGTDNGVNITINASPTVPVIGGGAATVCIGADTPPFTGSPTGGTWSVTPESGTASVTSSGGVVTGLSAGTVTITYTFTSGGCSALATQSLTINPLPTVFATTGGAPNVCVGSATPPFTNTTGVGVWSVVPGSGTANITTGGVVTGLTAGTVSVLFTYSSLGCSNAAITPLTVFAQPAITTSGTAAAVCNSTGVQTTNLDYSATTFSPISYSINWDATANAAGLADQALTSVAFVPGGGTLNNVVVTAGTPAGTYSGSMTITNGNGCTGSHAVTVTVNPLPNITLTIGGTGSICSGTGTNVTVAGSVSGTNYQLRDGLGPVGGVVAGTGGTIFLPTASLTATTTFSVWATLGTCSAQMTGLAVVTVNSLPTSGLTVGGAGTICSGSATTITVANSENGVRYQLRNGLVNVGSSVLGTGALISLPTGNLSANTTFNIQATNTTTLCAVLLTTTPDIIVSAPPNIGLAVSVPGGSICANTGTNIAVDGSVSGTNYLLRNNTTNEPIGTVVSGDGGTIYLPTGILTATTTFNVLATIGSCSAQLTQTAVATVNALPTVAITGLSDVALGSTITLTGTPAGGLWESASTGIATVNPSTGVVNGVALGTSLISYTYSNGTCSNTATRTVTVSIEGGIEDPKDNSGMALRNHPNPFDGNTTISYTLPADGRVTLTIRNLAGQKVKTVIDNEMESKGDYTQVIPASDMKSGVYFGTLSLKSNGKEIVKTIRLLKGQ